MSQRDYLHRFQSLSEKTLGQPHDSTDAIADAFAQCLPSTRISALDAFDDELNREAPANLRRYAELTSLRRKMGQVHETLRKAGR